MWGRSSRNRISLTLFTTALSTAAAQDPPLQIPRERVLNMDMRVDAQNPIAVGSTTGAAGLASRSEIRSRFPGAATPDGLRVHALFTDPPSAGWMMRIASTDGVVVDTVTPASIGAAREFWSEEVQGTVAIVELVRTASGRTPAVVLDYAYRVTPAVQQAIHGQNQLMPIANAPLRIRRFGPPVARLRFIIPGQGQATCTAFLVGRRLMLTNQHCIATADEMQSAIVDFNYDRPGATPQHVRTDAIVSSSAELDYTLLRLAADPPDGAGRLFFALDVDRVDHQPLFIVEHPSGEPKQVSIADCSISGVQRSGVSAADKTDFGHTCDTLGGSSGSPVLDWTTGRVVGLHHFGFLSGVPDPVNQAVHQQRILAHIKQRDAAAHAEVSAKPPS